jgi:N-acetylglucosamine kinase-like BadF-type ATPase
MNPFGQQQSPPTRVDGEVLLGVDGSGTTTQAVVADLSGHLLGRGLAPTCNHRKVGFEKAVKALSTAIEGALGQVIGQRSTEGPGWARTKIAAACLGLAGIGTAEDEALFTDWIRQQNITQRASVLNDSELILSGGTPEGWGVALISGTGSICLGRSRDGRKAHAGGWGYLFGDEGSGYRIGIEALRQATFAADGRADAPGLLRGVLSYLNLKAPDELIAHLYRDPVPTEEIAQLAIAVQDLATRGDAAASAIVENAAKDLALLAQTVIRKLHLVEKPPLALGGSALRATLKKMLLANIGVELGPVTVVQDPARAAVTIAQRLLNKK